MYRHNYRGVKVGLQCKVFFFLASFGVFKVVYNEHLYLLDVMLLCWVNCLQLCIGTCGLLLSVPLITFFSTLPFWIHQLPFGTPVKGHLCTTHPITALFTASRTHSLLMFSYWLAIFSAKQPLVRPCLFIPTTWIQSVLFMDLEPLKIRWHIPLKCSDILVWWNSVTSQKAGIPLSFYIISCPIFIMFSLWNTQDCDRWVATG